MAETAATLVLLAGGTEVVVGYVTAGRADLVLVDALMRVALAAKRDGCALWLRDASDELTALLELTGLDGILDPGRRAPENREP